MLAEIIRHNICKASYITGHAWEVLPDDYRKTYQMISALAILDTQNLASKDAKNGFVWVLNTGVFFVADYNFSLIESEQWS